MNESNPIIEIIESTLQIKLHKGNSRWKSWYACDENNQIIALEFQNLNLDKSDVIAKLFDEDDSNPNKSDVLTEIFTKEKLDLDKSDAFAQIFAEENLKYLTKLCDLRFEKCTINLSHFKAIAKQIEYLRFEDTEIKEPENFSYFENLEVIDAFNFHDESIILDLEHLLPLKENIKEIDIPESFLANFHLIKEFKNLEKVNFDIDSLETVQYILSLRKVKSLKLDLLDLDLKRDEKEIVLNLKELESVESLKIVADDNFYFVGMEHLQSLKDLDLYFKGNLEGLKHLQNLEFMKVPIEVNINDFPKIECLKDLRVRINDSYEIHSLEQFPNLERLAIYAEAGKVISLGCLEKLRGLKITAMKAEHTVCFQDLPNLEFLNLHNSLIGASSIQNLEKLSHLKYLDVAYNQLENIDEIATLKNLKLLNLAGNKMTDISVLNELSELCTVDFEDSDINKDDVEQQLEKTEIAEWIDFQWGNWLCQRVYNIINKDEDYVFAELLRSDCQEDEP